MRYQVFWTPKYGNTTEEYEDAFAGAPEQGRFAVADGASESSFARSWAELLVREFVVASTSVGFSWTAWLPSLQQCWLAALAKRPLPWHAQIKLEQGAFATFLGVVIEEHANAQSWQAVAVGDSCLFHLRGEQLLFGFPIMRSNEFDTSPWLVGSRTPPKEIENQGRAVYAVNDWQTGDRIWLMTDSLAAWYLRQRETGGRPTASLERVLKGPDSDEAFSELIRRLRDTNQIRNDDVTLVAVSL